MSNWRVVVTPGDVLSALSPPTESVPVEAGRSSVMPPTTTDPTLSSAWVEPGASVALVLT
jgi:hypothetical protein